MRRYIRRTSSSSLVIIGRSGRASSSPTSGRRAVRAHGRRAHGVLVTNGVELSFGTQSSPPIRGRHFGRAGESGHRYRPCRGCRSWLSVLRRAYAQHPTPTDSASADGLGRPTTADVDARSRRGGSATIAGTRNSSCSKRRRPDSAGDRAQKRYPPRSSQFDLGSRDTHRAESKLTTDPSIIETG